VQRFVSCNQVVGGLEKFVVAILLVTGERRLGFGVERSSSRDCSAPDSWRADAYAQEREPSTNSGTIGSDYCLVVRLRFPVNDFLNCITPGTDRPRPPMRGLPRHFLEAENEDAGIRFAAPFFFGATLSRCAALASRELARVMPPDIVAFVSRTPGPHDKKTLEALFERHRPARVELEVPRNEWMATTVEDALRHPELIEDLPVVPAIVSLSDWLVEGAQDGIAAV
jgi:hypothetical protein